MQKKSIIKEQVESDVRRIIDELPEDQKQGINNAHVSGYEL
jgi:DNA-directed RNA polymerase specialized sigma24 family protein